MGELMITNGEVSGDNEMLNKIIEAIVQKTADGKVLMVFDPALEALSQALAYVLAAAPQEHEREMLHQFLLLCGYNAVALRAQYEERPEHKPTVINTSKGAN